MFDVRPNCRWLVISKSLQWVAASLCAVVIRISISPVTSQSLCTFPQVSEKTPGCTKAKPSVLDSYVLHRCIPLAWGIVSILFFENQQIYFFCLFGRINLQCGGTRRYCYENRIRFYFFVERGFVRFKMNTFGEGLAKLDRNFEWINGNIGWGAEKDQALYCQQFYFVPCIQCEIFCCSKWNSWSCSVPHPYILFFDEVKVQFDMNVLCRELVWELRCHFASPWYHQWTIIFLFYLRYRGRLAIDIASAGFARETTGKMWATLPVSFPSFFNPRGLV